MTLRVSWLVYGTLEQPTGGYVYDRLIVEQLRAQGAQVEVQRLRPLDPGSTAATIAQLLESDADVVVGDALCVKELGPIFAALATRLRRALLVHHFGSWECEFSEAVRSTLRAQERRSMSHADLIVTTSRATAARLREEYPDCEPFTVEPGADRLRCPPRPEAGSELGLLGVGSLIPRKRWDLLLNALDQLQEPNLRLRWLGDDTRDPEFSRKLAAQVARSPYLSTHVEVVGVVEDDVLAMELAAADALVLPSSLEGYGMVLTEALHAGVPVIAARASAIPEALASHGAALLFDDEAGLHAQLNRFVHEPSLRSTLRRAAAQSALTLPTWAGAGSQFLACISHGLSPAVCDRSKSAMSASDDPA